jgi:hypothetical protein
MASGSSAYGNTGPCYRFWLAFKNCRVRGAPQTEHDSARRDTLARRAATAACAPRSEHDPSRSSLAMCPLHTVYARSLLCSWLPTCLPCARWSRRTTWSASTARRWCVCRRWRRRRWAVRRARAARCKQLTSRLARRARQTLTTLSCLFTPLFATLTRLLSRCRRGGSPTRRSSCSGRWTSRRARRPPTAGTAGTTRRRRPRPAAGHAAALGGACARGRRRADAPWQRRRRRHPE